MSNNHHNIGSETNYDSKNPLSHDELSLGPKLFRSTPQHLSNNMANYPDCAVSDPHPPNETNLRPHNQTVSLHRLQPVWLYPDTDTDRGTSFIHPVHLTDLNARNNLV